MLEFRPDSEFSCKFLWVRLETFEAFYLHSRLTRANLRSAWMLKRSFFTAILIRDPFRCKIPMYMSEQPPHLRKRKELRSTSPVRSSLESFESNLPRVSGRPLVR